MSRHPWLIFLAGALVGAGGLGFIWFSHTLKEAFIAFGEAEVYFDAEARRHIEAEVLPSANAADVYFYIEGFLDHRIFVAYTDSAEHLGKVVRNLTGKSVSEIEVWKDQIKHHAFAKADGSVEVLPDHRREPGVLEKKWLTSLYDVDVIRKGRFFEKDETSHGWHIIVDEETGRFYYHSWNT